MVAVVYADGVTDARFPGPEARNPGPGTRLKYGGCSGRSYGYSGSLDFPTETLDPRLETLGSPDLPRDQVGLDPT
jgi:hypothetical protein